MTSTDISALDQRSVEAFIYHEARLADEHRYDEWEALWSDDAVYWVPIHPDGTPGADMSIIYDNRRRLSTRLNQLRTGTRHAQTPPSRSRRVVSNCEIVDRALDAVVVEANFVLVEARTGDIQIWAGRTTYGIRVTDEGLRLSYKKVQLINSDLVLPTLAFLI